MRIIGTRYLYPIAAFAMTCYAQGPATQPPVDNGLPDWLGAWIFVPLALILLAGLFAFIATSETRAPHDKNDGPEDDAQPHVTR